MSIISFGKKTLVHIYDTTDEVYKIPLCIYSKNRGWIINYNNKYIYIFKIV